MLPNIGHGSYADATINGRRYRFFSEVSVLGWGAAVFDLDREVWYDREWAEDEEDGKRRAVEMCKPLGEIVPPLKWTKR